jgi:FAD/FMN-containing dehydrogenase
MAVKRFNGMRSTIEDLIDDLGEIPIETEPSLVRRRSRDFFWYSPVLNRQLHGKSAELVVSPRSEQEALRVAAACLARRIPITPRGAGTGNYGQAVPLEGGVLLDMSQMIEIEWIRPGAVRAGAGAKMHDIDAALKPHGWELRMHPSTKRMATIGGFVAGGSGGVGSVSWGVLRDPGNVLAARIVTMEDPPRAIELRGRDVQAVNHSYGVTGVITALEMPTAPAWEWNEIVVSFETFERATAFAWDLARSDGIVKKLVSALDGAIVRMLPGLQATTRPGQSVVLAMVAAPSMESLRSLLDGRGAIARESGFDENENREPLYEYSWNHTTLQWLKKDRSITYLQCLFPHERLLDSVAEMRAMFGDEVLYHLEFIRFGGVSTCSALPIVRFTTEERLAEIIALHESHGVRIANPHVWTLEDGASHKKPDADQLAFKARFDPFGLLNPGKLRSFAPSGLQATQQPACGSTR